VPEKLVFDNDASVVASGTGARGRLDAWKPGGAGIGRVGGCLWFVVAGFGFLFVAGAAGVGINASVVLVPLVLVPLVLAVLVLAAGHSALVLALSALAGFVYAGLGVWNFLRAAEFERAKAGSMEISGGTISLTFVLLALAIGLWSAGAAALARPRSEGS
jgi:hypothetical protein